MDMAGHIAKLKSHLGKKTFSRHRVEDSPHNISSPSSSQDPLDSHPRRKDSIRGGTMYFDNDSCHSTPLSEHIQAVDKTRQAVTNYRSSNTYTDRPLTVIVRHSVRWEASEEYAAWVDTYRSKVSEMPGTGASPLPIHNVTNIWEGGLLV